MGYSVLAVDTDPQGNFTDNLSVNIVSLMKNKLTLYDALYNNEETKYPIDKFISHTDYDNLDVLASDGRLGAKTQELQMQMNSFVYPYKNLMEEIKSLKQYDFIVIDTRPALSDENIQILLASDYTIIPTTTGARSTAGVVRVIEAVKRCNDAVKNCNNQMLGIILNQVNVKTSVAKAVIPDLQDTYKELMFNTLIPIDEKVKQAEQIGLPIGSWDANTRAAISYEEFAKEVLNRLD
jgi:chromosome partitioning protein